MYKFFIKSLLLLSLASNIYCMDKKQDKSKSKTDIQHICDEINNLYDNYPFALYDLLELLNNDKHSFRGIQDIEDSHSILVELKFISEKDNAIHLILRTILTKVFSPEKKEVLKNQLLGAMLGNDVPTLYDLFDDPFGHEESLDSDEELEEPLEDNGAKDCVPAGNLVPAGNPYRDKKPSDAEIAEFETKIKMLRLMNGVAGDQETGGAVTALLATPVLQNHTKALNLS